jgi:hypothetical protein
MQGITGVNEKVRLKVTLLNPPAFCGNSVNYILADDLPLDPKYLLGVLNSSLLNWLFKLQSTNSNVNGYEVDRLPIAVTDRTYQKSIAELVNRCMSAYSNGKKCVEVEKQIDELVYRLYGLKAEEIAIVEGSD